MQAPGDESSDLGLLSTAAVLVDPRKELIVATGADRVRFLHGIVTGNVEATPVGGGCHAALLTVKAHIVAEMRIFIRAADLYVVVAAGEGATTAGALSRYAIMDDFTTHVRPDFTFMALLGPTAGDRLAEVGISPVALASAALWSHADVEGTPGGLWLVRVRQLGVEGFWIGGEVDDVARATSALEQAGVPRLAAEVADVARIAAGEPSWGREITADYFPMEVGLDDAIDYAKGCFLGQEPIVRIRDRGHVNWRLARLDLDQPGAATGVRLPAPGDRLETDSKPKAGKLTSVGRLPDGRGVALGLVHISVPAGQQVRIRSTDAALIGSAVVVG